MNRILVVILFLSITKITLAQGDVDKQLGIQYFKEQQYTKAIDKLSSAYKSSPDDNTYQYLFDCYIEIEDYKEAEKLVSKHIKKNRRLSAIYYVDLGFVQLKQEDSKSAEESFNLAFEEVFKNPNIAYNVSQRYTSYGFFQEGLTTFEIAEKSNPNLIFSNQKAMIYAELGDLEKMYDTYLDMIEQNPAYYNSVKNMLNYSIKTDPNNEGNKILKELLILRVQKSQNSQFNDLLSWLLIQEKNFNQAFIQLKALDRRENRNQSEIYRLGEICIKNHEYAAAKKCFTYIVDKGELSPFYESSIIQNLFVDQYLLENDPTSTKEDYDKLVEEYDKVMASLGYTQDYIELVRKKALILAFKLNRPQDATTLLEENLNNANIHQKGVAESKISLGDILLSFGNPWDALLLYAQVDKAFAEGELGQEARYKKAMIAFYQGDFDWAKTQFDVLKTSTTKFIANDAMQMSIIISDNTFMDTDSTFGALKLYAQARLFLVREDYDSALYSLDTLEANYPNHSLQDEVLFERATIYLKTGFLEKAIASLKKIIEYYPDDILADEALYQLGTIYYEKLNDKTNAMHYLEELISKHGDSIFASEARDLYRMLRGDELYN